MLEKLQKLQQVLHKLHVLQYKLQKLQQMLQSPKIGAFRAHFQQKSVIFGKLTEGE